jgi:D-amino-acid dehydrogenase
MGMPVEVFNRQQTAEFDPGLRMDVAGAVYFKADCHLAPHLLMSALERLATDAGAEIHWETEITDFQTSGNRISGVQTNRGMLQADEYVLCAGSWSPLLAHRLRIALPMQAGKGYSLTLQQPRRLPRTCAILTEARIAVTPIGQTLRFGGTMELAGLDERIDPRRIEGIIEAVPRYLPEFQPEDFRGVQPWRGLRPVSPDGLPYIGRTARWGNLVMATGHAMLGVSLAPITGKLVSQIVAGESPEIDLSLLAPERFSA